jgi:hypothetical protein
VKEIPTDFKTVFYAISSCVIVNQVPTCFLTVIFEEQRRLLTAKRIHGELTDRTFITVEPDELIDALDVLMTPLLGVQEAYCRG